jgi:hypothetical protein
MPLYEYMEGGRRVVRRLPVAQRDSFHGRVTVPSRVLVCPRGEPTQGDEVLRGFSRAEETLGTEKVRLTAKALGLTRDQVKAVWAER